MRTTREINDALAVFGFAPGSVDAPTLHAAGNVLADETRRLKEELRQKVETIYGFLAERDAKAETINALRDALRNLLQRVDAIHPIRPDGKAKHYWAGAGDQDAAREMLKATEEAQ